MRLAVVLTVAIVANSLGNLFLSTGMKQYGASPPLGGPWLLQTAVRVVTNSWLIAGVLLLLIFLGAYLTALSWADLSFVLPATAPAYLLTEGLSRFFLNETVSVTRWAGTVLIVVGTWLVSRTHASSAPSHAIPAAAGKMEQAAVSAGSGS